MQMLFARELARTLGGLLWTWGLTSFAGGKSIGVYGTPAFYINGRRHDGPWRIFHGRGHPPRRGPRHIASGGQAGEYPVKISTSWAGGILPLRHVWCGASAALDAGPADAVPHTG